MRLLARVHPPKFLAIRVSVEEISIPGVHEQADWTRTTTETLLPLIHHSYNYNTTKQNTHLYIYSISNRLRNLKINSQQNLKFHTQLREHDLMKTWGTWRINLRCYLFFILSFFLKPASQPKSWPQLPNQFSLLFETIVVRRKKKRPWNFSCWPPPPLPGALSTWSWSFSSKGDLIDSAAPFQVIY